MRRECRQRFPPPPTSTQTTNKRFRHASRHVRHARAVMHVGIANLGWRGKRSRHSQRMRTRDLTHLARGPWGIPLLSPSPLSMQQWRVDLPDQESIYVLIYTGGKACCHNDNLRCQQGWPRWHYRFSMSEEHLHPETVVMDRTQPLTVLLGVEPFSTPTTLPQPRSIRLMVQNIVHAPMKHTQHYFSLIMTLGSQPDE